MDATAYSPLPSIISLLVVLAFIIALGWLLKRGRTRLGKNVVSIKPLGGLSIGPREKLLVVEIEDQWYVLGVTSHSINLVTQLAKKNMSTDQNSNSMPDFLTALQARLKK